MEQGRATLHSLRPRITRAVVHSTYRYCQQQLVYPSESSYHHKEKGQDFLHIRDQRGYLDQPGRYAADDVSLFSDNIPRGGNPTRSIQSRCPGDPIPARKQGLRLSPLDVNNG